MWAVKCEVWGGVTGYRQGLLRDESGKVQIFQTEDAAQAQAEECKQATRNPHAVAQFWYEPIQLPLTQGEH